MYDFRVYFFLNLYKEGRNETDISRHVHSLSRKVVRPITHPSIEKKHYIKQYILVFDKMFT